MSDYGEQSLKRAEIELETAKVSAESKLKLNEHWVNFFSPIGKILGSSIVVHLIWAVVVVKVAHMIFVLNGWIKCV